MKSHNTCNRIICLAPFSLSAASAFLTSCSRNKRRRVALITEAPFFCFAGTWRPETSDWPLAYAGLTVEANRDIAPFQDRHMAVVREEDWQGWLQGGRSEESILRPLPVGNFRVSGPPLRAAGDLFV